MSWTTRITGLDNLGPELQAEARLGVRDGLELLGAEGTKMVQDNIASPFQGKPPAVDTTNLLNSVISDVSDGDGQALARLQIGVGSSLGADKYAGPVETGARPHLPPVEALIPWVMRKLGASDEKQATSLAWAVAKSIAKKGTAGHEMFERAQIDLEPLAAPAIERAIAARLLAAGAGGAA
jgi:hypothetical protein